MRVNLIVFLLILPLSGCAGNAMQKANQQFDVLSSSCHAQYPLAKGTAVAREQCVNSADDATVVPLVSDPDIFQAIEAERLVVAQEIDAGQIDPADATLKISQFVTGETSIVQQRNLADSEMQAQRAQAFASVLAAEHINQPPPPPIYVPQVTQMPMPVTTNCSTYGTQTNCTTQ